MIAKLVFLLTLVTIASAIALVIGLAGYFRSSLYQEVGWLRIIAVSTFVGIGAAAAAWVLS